MDFVLFLQKVREVTDGVFDGFMLQVSNFADPLVTFLFVAFIYWCIDKRSGIRSALTLSVGTTFTEKGNLFQSDHTIRGYSVWGVLASREFKNERSLSISLWSILGLIMFSRCYLGATTLKGLILSFMLAAGLMLAFHFLLDTYENQMKKLKVQIGVLIDVLIIICSIIVSYAFLKKYNGAGAFCGFIIGYIIERRFIKYEIDGNTRSKMFRFIPGAIFLFFLFTTGASLFPHIFKRGLDGYALYFAAGLFISVIYPFIFSLWEQNTISNRARRIGKVIVVSIMSVTIGVFVIITAISIALNESASDIIEKARFIIDGDEIFWKDTGEDNYREEETISIEIIAHRGYSGISPENTLASFKRSVDIGADQIELDVQMTKDGVVVVFHDSVLSRITGFTGKIKDYNYSEMCWFDAGSWYDDEPGSGEGKFCEERIPTLEDVMKLIQDSDIGINLELKNIGDVDGFEEAVVKVVQKYGMEDRVIFSSYNYNYLKTIKAMDENLKIEYISDYGEPYNLINNYPADYYNLKLSGVQDNTAEVLHEYGAKFYVWTLNDVESMQKAIELGADGLVTNYPGLAQVVVHQEYPFINQFCKSTFTVPVLYDYELQEKYSDYVMQGMTVVGDEIWIAAYDFYSRNNSVLYIVDKSGNLKQIIDLGIKAHAGGIAFDTKNEILWVTGSDGLVYAFDWYFLSLGFTEGVSYTLDPGFINQYGDKIVSFLTIDDNLLYVGSNMDGVGGEIKVYDITYPGSERLVSIISIPEHIQGVTFSHESRGRTKIIMTQSYQNEDSNLLIFTYSEDIISYDEKDAKVYVLPDGAEQPCMTDDGLYLLFHTSARPLRTEVNVVNDQIWLFK